MQGRLFDGGAISSNAFLAHVQGLRAIAVLTVLIHHLDASYLPGGFIGVDIFFVISGFLITNQIHKQRSKGAFTFRGFYFRRIRRIIPNQVLVIMAVVVAAYCILDEGSFELTAASGAYSALMMANVFFWQNSGYFAPAAETMPLLHMWSLAVEEQFYLIWPAALIAAAAVPSRARSWGLALGLLALVLFTEWTIETAPNAAFYMTPFRVLEFMCGAALVFWRPPHSTRAGLFAIAAALVLAACLILYSPATRFPGLAALVPCLATSAIIAYGGAPGANAALGNRLAIAIGDRSYAMYLVHWPVIVFLKASYPFLDPTLRNLAIFAVTAALTEVLFQAWEKPLRYWSLPTFKRRLAYGSAILAASAALAMSGVVFGKAQMFGSTAEKAEPTLRGCANDPAVSLAECDADILVIGDSHRGHMQKLFRATSGMTVAETGFEGCPPVLGAYHNYSHRKDRWKTAVCRNLIAQWEAELPKTGAKTIVLAARWGWLSEPGNYAGETFRREAMVIDNSTPLTTKMSRQVLKDQLDYTVRTLQAAGKRVILAGQVPLRTRGEIACAKANEGKSDAALKDQCQAVSKEEALSRLRFMNETIRALGRKYPEVQVLIPSDFMCREECTLSADGVLLYRDDNHLNAQGAEWLAKQISPLEQLP